MVERASVDFYEEVVWAQSGEGDVFDLEAGNVRIRLGREELGEYEDGFCTGNRLCRACPQCVALLLLSALCTCGYEVNWRGVIVDD